jgi:phosphate transport system protein
MKNYKRKLQLIAGSTYSVSLPKEWVKDLNLKPQQELILNEDENRNLTIFPGDFVLKDVSSVEIFVEDYFEKLEQIICSLYYYGFDDIKLKSKTKFSLEIKRKIRETLLDLSGAEIVYEDQKEIQIKVMFNELNWNLFQIFYRINLIIQSTIENLLGNFDWKEIQMNEDEIDRLYNLSVKIITSAVGNRNILISSGIKDLKIIPSLFLISKRLENVADNFKKIGSLMKKEKIKVEELKEILEFISLKLNGFILYLMNEKKKIFEIISEKEKIKFKKKISEIKHRVLETVLDENLKYLGNIQEEIISIDIFKKFVDN